MVKLVRLYVDPLSEMPYYPQPGYVPSVIDVLPHHVRKTRRHLKKRGYEVIAVPL